MTTPIYEERDALAALGLLAHAFVTWDPPIPAGRVPDGRPIFTHFAGLNIHALVLDNEDGEVIAVERNRIHEYEDPTRHAELAAMRSALARIAVKRPRPVAMSVEEYYATKQFYVAEADYRARGCTLYTTLEPCPMCTATLCVARMKRTAYVIPDQKFGGSFPSIHGFYNMFDLAYDRCAIVGATAAAQAATAIVAKLELAVADMHAHGAHEISYLDSVHELLGEALQGLAALRDTDVQLENARTLGDLKRFCRIPG